MNWHVVLCTLKGLLIVLFYPAVAILAILAASLVVGGVVYVLDALTCRVASMVPWSVRRAALIDIGGPMKALGVLACAAVLLLLSYSIGQEVCVKGFIGYYREASK